jgi:hypothetical protein
MTDNAASDRAPDTDRTGPDTGSTPPLADLTGRPEPAPGPLTKPAPVVRPPKRRARWLVPAVSLLALAAVAGIVIAWVTSWTGMS